MSGSNFSLRKFPSQQRKENKIASLQDLRDHPEKVYLLVEGSSDLFYDTYKRSSTISVIYVKNLGE